MIINVPAPESSIVSEDASESSIVVEAAPEPLSSFMSRTYVLHVIHIWVKFILGFILINLMSLNFRSGPILSAQAVWRTA
jgi:hypothetical protein